MLGVKLTKGQWPGFHTGTRRFISDTRPSRSAANQRLRTQPSGQTSFRPISRIHQRLHSTAESFGNVGDGREAHPFPLRQPLPLTECEPVVDISRDRESNGTHLEAVFKAPFYRLVRENGRCSLASPTIPAEDSDLSTVSSSKGGNGTFSGGPSSSTPYPPPSSFETFKSMTSRRGQGTGGRHRCPKCGAFVTFRHGDFEINNFYCATCSGWFTISSEGTLPTFDGVSGGYASPHGVSNDIPPPKKGVEDERRQRIVVDMSDRSTQGTNGAISNEPPHKTSGKFDDSGSGMSMPGGQMPTPRQIMQGLDEYVVGQTAVKIALSVGVYNHYKRILISESRAATNSRKKEEESQEQRFPAGEDDHGNSISGINFGQYGREIITGDNAVEKEPVANEIAVDVEDCEIDKSNIMLLGPTGSGKTHLVKTLARLVDVPLVITDATCLTQAGYVGEDVESILFKLYLESGQDLEKCQRGIIYIDETDKIRKSGGNVSISRDVSGEGVQHALLKIVEGNIVNVPKEMGRKNPSKDFRQIDTTNILFICGGAFAGLERIVNSRIDSASIGFGAEMKKEIGDPQVQGKYFDSVVPKDLVDFGMIPEFVGRFPIIVSTKGLSLENLIGILTEPKNSILKQYQRLFSIDDVKLHITKCGLEAIAETALSRGTGARGLRSITDQILMETQFVVPSMPDVHTVYVDAAAVRMERKPVLLQGSMTVEKYEADEQHEMEGATPVSLDEEFEDDQHEAAV